MNIALALFPDFALILLGFALRRWMALGDHFWSGLEKLIYFVLFPALLFNAITKTPLSFAAVPLIGTGAAAMAGAMLLALAARPFVRVTPLSFASQFQCAFRYNTYIGLAVAAKLHGTLGRDGRALAAWLLTVKLVAMPLLALAVARAIGLRGIHFDVAIMFAALPTASSAYILAQRMGGDGARVAWLISAGTLLGMASLPFWLTLLLGRGG